MKILVTGGRNLSDRDSVYLKVLLSRLHTTYGISEIIEGGQTGADEVARNWANDNEVSLNTFHPDWMLYGKAAGPMRNQRMLEQGDPDMVISCPGGAGTKDCTKRARSRNVPIIYLDNFRVKMF